MGPKSERIVVDIDRFPSALNTRIAAKCEYVPELDTRGRGRRRVGPAARARQTHNTPTKLAHRVYNHCWLSAEPRTSQRRPYPLETTRNPSLAPPAGADIFN